MSGATPKRRCFEQHAVVAFELDGFDDDWRQEMTEDENARKQVEEDANEDLELADEDAEHVGGGAYEAYLNSKGIKQGPTEPPPTTH